MNWYVLVLLLGGEVSLVRFGGGGVGGRVQDYLSGCRSGGGDEEEGEDG